MKVKNSLENSQLRVFRLVSAVSLLGATLAALDPTLAQAQSGQPPLPSRDDFDLEPIKPVTEKSQLEIKGDIERAPCVLADPAYSEIKFTLQQAEFNNLAPVSADELRQSYASLIGRELPIAAVCDIRDAAATYLRQRGYLAAVEVPVQRIENGVVRFEIVYAKLTTVRVLGEAGTNAKLIEATLGKLVTGQPFNRLDAERHLLLARDIPGYSVRLNLKPTGENPGDMIGEVILQRSPVEADLSIQNLAARDTGRFAGQLRVQLNGLTGMGDRTTLGFYSTADFREQYIVQAAHEMRLGSDGLRLSARLNHAWSKPSLGAALPNVKARTLFVSSELSYPLVRRLAGSLQGTIGLDIVNQRVEFGGLPLSRDNIRTGFLRLGGEASDLAGTGPNGMIGWRFGGSIEARRGFDLWKASPNCVVNRTTCAAPGFVPPSLFNGDPTPTLFRALAFADAQLARNVSVALQGRAQTTKSTLPAFEKFSIGNYTIGRGYDPGASVGDRGIGYSGEIRIDSVRLSKSGKFQVQPYVFSDNAWLGNRGLDGTSERISSLGGGLRFNLADRLRVDASLAVPTRSTTGFTQRGDTRFLISLSTNILPWRTR
jgi:hemolysin activation/secretion protein